MSVMDSTVTQQPMKFSCYDVDNLAEMISSSVENFPSKPIIYADSKGSRVTTYRETYDESEAILSNLYKHGVKTGDIVVLALDNHADFIPVIWACIL